jgi:hypothetical protein
MDLVTRPFLPYETPALRFVIAGNWPPYAFYLPLVYLFEMSISMEDLKTNSFCTSDF